MKDDGSDSFLTRWSRRKVAARVGKPLDEPARPPGSTGGADVPQVGQRSAGSEADKGVDERRAGADPPAQPENARPELPSIDALRGLESEYREFLRSDVDDGTRRAALKKLFADPHFNRMDGLDVYIDDYSQPDPIPAAMLRTLSHAKDLLFGAEEKTAREAPTGEPAGDGDAHRTDAAAQEAQPDSASVTDSGMPDASRPANAPNCPECAQLSQKKAEEKNGT
jgi:hypothetical protein